MRIRPSIRLSVLPAARPLAERFRLAVETGFEGIEIEAKSAPAAEIREAADRTGLVVHSVHFRANSTCPLSSRDPAVRSAGTEAMIAAIRFARDVGAETLLIVPGIVTSDTSYGEVYSRSQEVIGRDILPVAADHGVTLAVENVWWSGFLLGPIDYARYLDDFASPWLRAYLDTGNIIFGRPEGWIDILGHRICKLHLKDCYFRFDSGRFGAAKIGRGDIDWARVRAALERTGFAGWAVLAEPENGYGRLAGRAYNVAIRQQAGVPALGAVQTLMARPLLRDVMRRFRTHVVG